MPHVNRAIAAPLLLCALLLAGLSGAEKPDQGTAFSSTQTAESLLSAMKSEDYSTAYEMFDSKMKAAVSEGELKAIWSAQVGTLGPLASWTITERPQAQGFDVRFASLRFERGELQARMFINPGTQEVVGFFLRPAPGSEESAPPAPYVRASDFRPMDTSFGTAPFVLPGTVTVPVGLGPFPGVVLIHGSGPQDRDETIGTNKIFKDLAEGLASRGIEVLRYDKRTYVHQIDSISVDDEVVVDAVAAIGALRSRPEIDPQRVFVIGHSLGALLAPEVATRSGSVAGVVLLAPPGRPLWDIVLSQVRYLGAPPREISEVELKAARVKAGTLGTERFLGAPQSYWKDLAARDGIGMARKLAKPVLVLRGDRDYQTLEEDVEAWRRGLSGTPNVQIATLPGLNHLFMLGTGKPGPAEYEKPGHVDGRVIDKIAAFIAASKAKSPKDR